MPALSVEALRNHIRAREFAPVYLLYGPETYMRDVAARTIAEKAFGEGDFRDLNETTFSLSTDPEMLRQAIGAAQQLPMMATRRLVKITGVRISATGFRDSITEDSESALRNYLSDPSPSSVVVFVADELNGNRKMAKLLKELTAAVEFAPLSDADLAEWVRGELKKTGSQASPQVIQQLVARVGPDARRLTNEINKLSAAALPDTVITGELIEQLVPASRELDNFDLTSHLIAGRKARAILVLKKILDDGAEPVALIGLILYAYRRLVMVKDLMDRGVDRREAAGVLKLRYSEQEQYFAAARRTQMSSLADAVRSIAAADLAIKTSIGGSTSGARMQVEMLVAKLALMTAN
jgi:DNA polymerase-3 subunit delta